MVSFVVETRVSDPVPAGPMVLVAPSFWDGGVRGSGGGGKVLAVTCSSASNGKPFLKTGDSECGAALEVETGVVGSDAMLCATTCPKFDPAGSEELVA